MGTITFNNEEYTTVNGIFELPVPDGYHYGSGCGEGNEDWFYIVPERVSLQKNHIDATPFSFAITRFSVEQCEFDSRKTNAYKKAFVQAGALSSDVWSDTLIISSTCAFFYQCWTNPSDLTYRKINGLLVAGSDVYQFHIFENYDEPVADQREKRYEFMDVALSWMANVSFIGDAPYVPEDPEAIKASVVDAIDKTGDIVAKGSGLLGLTMDYETELKKHFITVGGLLYQHHNITLNTSAVSLLSEMVGPVDGQKLDVPTVRSMMNNRDSNHGDVHDYIQSFSVISVIKQLVKVDKIAKIDSQLGMTNIYYETMDGFMQMLCCDNGIPFMHSSFYRQCKLSVRLMIDEIWETINIEVFPGDQAGSAADCRSLFTEPEFTAEYTDDTDFEIDEDDCRLREYNGTEANVRIPDGVQIIGKSAFFMKDILSVVIPEGVRELEDDAFWGCKQLGNVQLPTTLEKIGSGAFNGCERLMTIVIPEGVTEIGPDAFAWCSNLEHIYLPESLRDIGIDAFMTFCDDIVLHVPKFSNAETYAQDNELEFDHQKPGEAAPKVAGRSKRGGQAEASDMSRTGKSEEIIVGLEQYASYIEKDPQITIEEKIFVFSGLTAEGQDKDDHPTIQKVLILGGKTLTIVGALTHYLVVNPARVEVSKIKAAIEQQNKGERVKIVLLEDLERALSSPLVVDGKALAEKFTIKETVLEKYIGTETEVTVPEGITEISSFAFIDTNITSVILPNSVKKIGMYAFCGCVQLKQISISRMVTSVEEYAFAKCSSLTEITWPGNVTKLPRSVFDHCHSLKTVIIEEGVTEIGESAFSFCKSLKDMYLPYSLIEIGKYFFLGASEPTLHVYSDSYAEKYAKENDLRTKIIPSYQRDAELKRRQEEEECRQREYEEQCCRESEEEHRRKSAEEEEAKRQHMLAEKRVHYNEIRQGISKQERIIAENGGWFGEQAKARKAAQQQLAILQDRLAREFPNGRP